MPNGKNKSYFGFQKQPHDLNEPFSFIHVCCLLICSPQPQQGMTQGFTLSSSLNYLCFDFKFCCLTQSSAEIMTVWSSQLPGDSWSLLAGKCSTQNSYAEQISIFLHQMLVSRCHRLVKSLETPQEKICEYVCGRPGDKNNLVVLWEGIYSLIRWCSAIPVQGTQSGGCYTGTSIAVNSFPLDSSASFAAPSSPGFSGPGWADRSHSLPWAGSLSCGVEPDYPKLQASHSKCRSLGR